MRIQQKIRETKQAKMTDEIVRRAVFETLVGLGFDVREPGEIQADIHYLRRMRKGSEDMRKIVRHSLLTLMISTGIYVLWEAAKSILSKQI